MRKQASQISSSNISDVLSIILLPMVMLISTSATAETYYFHNDQLGTPQVVTDNTQQIVWKGEYDPFGELTETVASLEQNLRFPGQYFDVETGLHYNYFRSYDPGTGRYVESDPVGLSDGVSTFIYVNADPIRYIDPMGLFKISSVGLINSTDRRYQFRFTFGCKLQRIADLFNPGRKAGMISRLQKRYQKGTTSGENDVSRQDLCACRNVDSDLNSIYRKNGYSIGQTLSRKQAEKLIAQFEEYLENQSESGCSDCSVASKAYPWGQLLDNADNRSIF